ncbi:hypothetical protein BHE74_00017243 [Ensete ventricosum]|nr:hypothetical protein GW17_00000608 [Ensete ventricosum]RWW74796.1 hypothetical protein BHE74_00017243 [Ensete ventricosum]
MRSKWVPKGDAPSDFSGSRSVLLRNYTLDENNNDRVDDDGDVWYEATVYREMKPPLEAFPGGVLVALLQEGLYRSREECRLASPLWQAPYPVLILGSRLDWLTMT